MTSIYHAPLGRILEDIEIRNITRIRDLLTWSDEHGDGPHITFWAKLFDSKTPFLEKVIDNPLSMPINYGLKIATALCVPTIEIELMIAEDHLHYLKQLFSEQQKDKAQVAEED